MNQFKYTLIGITLLLGLQNATAATLQLKNGKTLKCEVIEMNSTTLKVKTADGNIQTYNQSAIKKLTMQDEAPTATLKEEETKATIKTQIKTQEPAVAETTSVPTGKTDEEKLKELDASEDEARKAAGIVGTSTVKESVQKTNNYDGYNSEYYNDNSNNSNSANSSNNSYNNNSNSYSNSNNNYNGNYSNKKSYNTYGIPVVKSKKNMAALGFLFGVGATMTDENSDIDYYTTINPAIAYSIGLTSYFTLCKDHFYIESNLLFVNRGFNFTNDEYLNSIDQDVKKWYFTPEVCIGYKGHCGDGFAIIPFIGYYAGIGLGKASGLDIYNDYSDSNNSYYGEDFNDYDCGVRLGVNFDIEDNFRIGFEYTVGSENMRNYDIGTNETFLINFAYLFTGKW